MKKVVTIIIFSLFLLQTLSAFECNVDVNILNQDPYPAIPGDYVKVVFQITGLEDPQCGQVEFGIKEEYPISLDPNMTNPIKINSGTFQRQYSSFYLAPIKIRIDEDAIKGDNPIEVQYSTALGEFLKELNIYIEDSRANFEVYVKDYNYETKILTLEILNIEEVDVEALTIEIPEQENIEIKGANKKVVGDLDSNEYTTADFESIMTKGEIELKIIYTDSINVRRTLNKTIQFEPNYFLDRNANKSSTGYWIFLIIVIIIIWFSWKRYKKNKEKKMKKLRR